MNTVVWIIQGILVLIFAMAGIMKTTQPKDKLVKSLPWVNDYSLPTVRHGCKQSLAGGYDNKYNL